MSIGVVLLTFLMGFAVWKLLTLQATDSPIINIDDAVIIDVRSPTEFASGHVQNAINVPLDTITEGDVLKHARQDQPIVLYCRSGGRASIVHHRMKRWGFSNVHNLKTRSGVQNAMNPSVRQID